MCALCVAKDPILLPAESEDSDQSRRMPEADLCLRWAHTSFCWFCHAADQMMRATSGF